LALIYDPSRNSVRTIEEATRWQATEVEPVLDADRPIVDAHHHLWRGRTPHNDYLDRHFVEDLGGHNIRATVVIETGADYWQTSDLSLRPVSETEFMAGLAGASATNRQCRIAAAYVARADFARPRLSRGFCAARASGTHLRRLAFPSATRRAREPGRSVSGDHDRCKPRGRAARGRPLCARARGGLCSLARVNRTNCRISKRPDEDRRDRHALFWVFIPGRVRPIPRQWLTRGDLTSRFASSALELVVACSRATSRLTSRAALIGLSGTLSSGLQPRSPRTKRMISSAVRRRPRTDFDATHRRA
jgi:hypothetical protein